jgi:Leucine-rich repeat (LRR) protein
VTIKELEITKNIFPDVAFREYIINHFDTDKNEKLSSDEISKIENVDVSKMGIEDLTGIEYFTNISYLYCNGNKLKTLNLSTLTKMTVLDCSNNNLSNLDLSKCVSLISLECKKNSFAISMDENNSFDLSTLKDINL